MKDALISRKDAMNRLLEMAGCESGHELYEYVTSTGRENDWIGGVLDSVAEIYGMIPPRIKLKKRSNADMWFLLGLFLGASAGFCVATIIMNATARTV